MSKSKSQTSTPPTDHVAAVERERLVSLINSMGDAVVAVDENLKVVVYNGASLNILDRNSDLMGVNITKILHLQNKNNQEVSIAEMLENLKTQYSNRDYRIVYDNDDYINIYLSVAPVHLNYGSIGAKGYVILMRDITREKSLEDERDEFISVVSHELRTPIAISEGNLSNAMLIASKTPDLPEKISSALKASYDQIIFLSGMINDLATLSRAERGKLNVEVESINVFELLNDLVHDYSTSANDKGLKFVSHPSPSLELLHSSKLYVREIIQNFVTNAIKYTDTGSVTVSATPHKNGVLFEVCDTGIGISKADKEKVFDKFFRSEDFRTRKNAGTGLGLYVTMKLARLIHADIDVESEINKGSSFSIYIPNI